MPPPSPWERVAPSLPAEEQTPAWATLVLAGAARGWMIFAIVWGSIIFLGQNITQNVFTGHKHSSSTQFNTVRPDSAAGPAAPAATAPGNRVGTSTNGCTTIVCLVPAYITVAPTLDPTALDPTALHADQGHG